MPGHSIFNPLGFLQKAKPWSLGLNPTSASSGPWACHSLSLSCSFHIRLAITQGASGPVGSPEVLLVVVWCDRNSHAFWLHFSRRWGLPRLQKGRFSLRLSSCNRASQVAGPEWTTLNLRPVSVSLIHCLLKSPVGLEPRGRASSHTLG